MAEEEAKGITGVDVRFEGDASIFLRGDLKFEINHASDVIIYKSDGVKMRPGIADIVAKKETGDISISPDFNTVSAFGATLEFAADGGVTIHTNGEVKIEQPTATAETGGRRSRYPRATGG